MIRSFSGHWLLLFLLLPLLAGAQARRSVGTIRLADGGRVGLVRITPRHPAPAAAPVLLVPDFGFGPEAFSFRGRGLAHALVRAGREVYVLDWRGRAHPDPEALGLGRLLERELPAIFGVIQGRHRRAVDVVAHGYAGSLVIAAAAHELDGRVGRVVALSTPVELALPNPHVERLLAAGGAMQSAAHSPRGAKTIELLLASDGRFPRGLWTRFRRQGLTDLPPRTARELLAWMREGQLLLGADGESLATRLARYDRPTLLVLPLGNNFAHPEHAAPLRELAPGAPIRLHLLSRLDLRSEDYTHLSMLHGRDAARDVWAPALRFLEEGTP